MRKIPPPNICGRNLNLLPEISSGNPPFQTLYHCGYDGCASDSLETKTLVRYGLLAWTRVSANFEKVSDEFATRGDTRTLTHSHSETLLAATSHEGGSKLGIFSHHLPITHPSAGSPLLVHRLSLSPPTHPLASFHKWPWLYPPSTPHLTRSALTSPTPRQSELVCGACIGTTQISASLVALLGFIFKRSSLRSFRDMIIIS